MLSFLTNFFSSAQAQAASGDVSRRAFLGATAAAAVTAAIGCDGSESTTEGSGGYGGGMNTGSEPTPYKLDSSFGKLPAAFCSDFNAYAQQVLGVATTGGDQEGDRNHLFLFDPRASDNPIPAIPFIELPEVAGRSLNKLTRREKTGIITANDGFYEVNLVSGNQRFIPFPAGNNFGGGAVYAGNKLFVAVANGTVNANATVTYGTGRVLIYDVNADGTVQEETVRSIDMQGKNPTGISLVQGSTVLVLSSGDFTANASAYLNAIDAGSEFVINSISLGNLTAQVSHTVAVTPDGGTAVIGTASRDDASLWSGQVLFVDLNSGEVKYGTIPGTAFHASVVIDEDGKVAFITDFNKGTVDVLDLATVASLQSLSLASGQTGPAILYGADLLQSAPYKMNRIYPQ